MLIAPKLEENIAILTHKVILVLVPTNDGQGVLGVGKQIAKLNFGPWSHAGWSPLSKGWSPTISRGQSDFEFASGTTQLVLYDMILEKLKFKVFV